MDHRFKRIGSIFLSIVVTLSWLIVFTACRDTREAVLYLYNWTYYTPDSVIKTFEKKYNAKVVYDDFASNEDMFAKLMAGSKGYDLVIPSADYVSIMIKLNMLDPIDVSKIPNIRYLRSDVLHRIDYDPKMEFSVPYYMGAAGIAVNTKEVPDYERGWNIFEQADLKNRMTMMDDMREVLGAALGSLGYEPNSTNPDELEQAYQLVQNNWKPNLVKFDADGFAKSFASGDFLAVHSGLYIDSFCIPKGAPHPELAHAFINFMLEPTVYAEFLDTFGFPPSIHTEAGYYQKKRPHYALDDLKDCILKKDLGANLELYNSFWQRIRFTP